MSREVDERLKEWLVESAQRTRMSRLRYTPTSFSASTSAAKAADAAVAYRFSG